VTVARGPGDHRSIAVMRDEIATIPAVIADQATRLRPPLRDLAERLGPGLQEIVLTGCGDSHYAGIATRLAFQRAAGLRVAAIEALELVRYDVRYVPAEPAPLLVAVSYSGEVGRTIEAVATAGEFGWRTMAFTGRPEGRLARRVSDPILMDVPTLGFSPGTSTYIAMLTALLVLAAELARARGRTSQATALDDALARAPELARRTLDGAEAAAHRAAERLAAAPASTFIGAGPSRATAAFGAAKLFEGPQRHGVVQDLEEWAHEQYFISGPATPIVVVAPSGASRDRAAELLAEMAFIGAPAILVSDVTDDAAARSAAIRLPVAAGLDEAASPILTCLPLAQAAFFVAERLGTRSYGFPSPEHEREHYETIHRATRGEPA
jgi:glucosamine--fructose-6-phosphate aminotransferase (isomerizing)